MRRNDKAPTDRLGRPLYATVDEDSEPVLYIPHRWPAINIDIFGQSRAYGYPANHPEVLLNLALEEAVLIDSSIHALENSLATGIALVKNTKLDRRGTEKVRETLRFKLIGFESLIADVYNTMGPTVGEEFERRARSLTGRAEFIYETFEQRKVAHPPETEAEQTTVASPQLSLFA